MKSKLLLTCLLWFVVGSFTAFAQLPQSEKDALIKLYQSLDGKNWNEGFVWDLNQDPSKWFGVKIDQNHVVEIVLNGAGLKGTLPEGVFSKLPWLKLVSMGSNPQLTGTIPTDFSSLKQLEAIGFGSVGLTGQFPALDAFPNLKVVNVSMNNLKREPNGFTVTMPDFNKIPHLAYFEAGYCGLKGTINDGIGKCTDLFYFDISGNFVEGSLPQSLNNCTKMKDFSVQDNKLSGEIPDLSNFTEITYQALNGFYGRLFFNQNNFSGPFPRWINLLPDVKRIRFDENHLTGEIPNDLSGLFELEDLTADNNEISGKLPTNLPPKLSTFSFENNKLTGTLPAEWKNAKELTSINLSKNALSGKVLLNPKGMEQLERVYIDLNNFTFADFVDWQKFAKDTETRFLFGLQRPYGASKTINAKSGEKVTFDATIPAQMPKAIKLTYSWYNIKTMQKASFSKNAAVVEIPQVSVNDVANFICLITTDYFGNDPAGVQEESLQIPNYTMLRDGDEDGENTEEENRIYTPMMASGIFKLVVDGVSGTEPIYDEQNTPKVYPSTTTGSLTIDSPKNIETLFIFTPKGEKVFACHPYKLENNTLDISYLPRGNYFVVFATIAGKSYTQTITRK